MWPQLDVDITFDPAKNTRNIELRGISFERAAEMAFDTALVFADTRKDYGEDRYSAIGPIANRLHVLIFTPTATGIRIISLRKANEREVKRYEQAQAEP